MSIVPKETIEVIAQSMGIPGGLSPDVALALAPDAEYRLREIMQLKVVGDAYVQVINGCDLGSAEIEAIKCMRHSKRTVLTTEDVDSALSLRNVEPIYGFASGDPLRFKKAVGHKDLFYIDDKDVDFKEVIEAPLPKAPLDVAVVAHWLAIEGVQPAIPENAPVEVVTPGDSKRSEHIKEDGLSVDIKLPVKHVLSRELQLYFDKIIGLIVSKSESAEFKEALVSLATDSGLHPLIPYFTYFIADEVRTNLNDLSLLFALMRVVRSLLRNKHIHLEPYLHQLMPPIMTCIVAKRLGHKLADNHWELRDFCANLVASLCKRFGHVYHNLEYRLTKTLVNAFLDPSKALTQHYGAIQGISALGPDKVSVLILPNLETYLQLLEPEMLLETQRNEMKRNEAWRVYGALLNAAGKYLYERLKLFPGLVSPLMRPSWRGNGKVATAIPNKRTASGSHMLQQPPHKKLATDGSVGLIASNAITPSIQGSAEGSSGASSQTGLGPSSSVGMMSNDISISGARRDKGNGMSQKASTILAQAWKEDVNAGKLLASLFELFGEGIFTFTRPADASIFL